MSNTWINKINHKYFKSSFDLEIYVMQFCFQYIIILLIIANLEVWIHIIYPHKIFINGSYIYI
jgi:hypothetical protein